MLFPFNKKEKEKTIKEREELFKIVIKRSINLGKKIKQIKLAHHLGQVLIRQGCEVLLPDVELNKFVRVASAPQPIRKANNI